MNFMDEITKAYYNSNPNAAFNYLFPTAGGNSRRSQFTASQYQPLYSQYQAQGPEQPNTSFMDFLNNKNLNFNDQYSLLARSQRGVSRLPNAQYKPQNYGM